MDLPLLLLLLALLLGALGAALGAVSLVQARSRAVTDEAARARERERTVSAVWIERAAEGSGAGERAEIGLLVLNRGADPVRSVTVTTLADGVSWAAPVPNPLLPGETFIPWGAESADPGIHQRLCTAAISPVTSPAWRVDRVSFYLDGLNVAWAAKHQPTRRQPPR